MDVLSNCVLAAKAKCTRRGVKEVVKSIRKKEKGYICSIGC